jgi:hypothetical protein
MAQDKKSFIIHIDSLDVLDDLDDKNIAELFKAIRDYNKYGETNLDGIMKAVFNPFKNQFDRDFKKYSGIVERNKFNGSKGGRPTKESKEKEAKKPTGLFGLLVEPQKADNDNVNGNDTVNDILLEKETKEENLKILLSKNEIFSLELLQSQQWIETVSMQSRITPEEIPKWIGDFNQKLISELDNKISKKEYASHFSRWLPSEILKSKKEIQTNSLNRKFSINQ